MTPSSLTGGSDGEGVWPCGHARTPENTKLVRNKTGVACRECFKAHNRLYGRARYVAQREALGHQVRPYQPRRATPTPTEGEQS